LKAFSFYKKNEALKESRTLLNWEKAVIFSFIVSILQSGRLSLNGELNCSLLTHVLQEFKEIAKYSNID
jgi:hypothetical protein